jgi:hypothetical protein
MKVFIFLMVFLSSSMLVYSQNRADTTLYIEPISGGPAADRTFFEENLKMEASAAGYNVIDELIDAIYSIGGSIAPEDDGNVLSITLSNVAESREMVTQELFYLQVEESYETLPFLVWQMMANAPFLETEAPPPASPPPVVSSADPAASRMAPIVNLINAVPDDDTWKNKWIYLGAKFGPSLHFYTTGSDSVNKNVDTQRFTVAAGLEALVQVLDFLNVQIEVNFGMDNADYRGLTPLPGSGTVTVDPVYKSLYLYFPLLVKGVLKPGRTFLVEPYGGAYLNLDLGLEGNNMQIPVGGWIAGAGFGFKVGSGVLFFDLRYATDFLDTTVTGEDYGGLVELRRHTATISAGYKIGFLNRKQSATRFRGARYQ